MPRIISDELFDSLMECVKAQRLLGVMGKLERLQETAVEVICIEDSVYVPLDSQVYVVNPKER